LLFPCKKQKTRVLKPKQTFASPFSFLAFEVRVLTFIYKKTTKSKVGFSYF